MNILVTGGAGFIGSNLACRLLDEGHAVTILDSLSPQVHGREPENDSPLYAAIRGRVRFLHASVCDDIWAEALEGQDAVVHLAAETGTGQSMYEIRRYVEVNVGGTARLLDFLANNRHGVKRMVVASSRAIYGEGKYLEEDGTPIYPAGRNPADMKAGRFELYSSRSGKPLTLVATNEDVQLRPGSVYGITKLNQEQMVMTVCPSLGIEAVALRYQNVYGPGQSLSNPYTGILSIFSTRIRNGNPINIFEDGRESRDFVFIDDVVDATLRALVQPEAANHVFAIGSGVATDVLSVARALVACYARDVPVEVTGAFRLGDIRHNLADIAKARRLLGFEPKVDFAEGIRRFAAWVVRQAVAEDTYESSIAEMRRKGLYQS